MLVNSCTSCHTENPADARTCYRCGTALREGSLQNSNNSFTGSTASSAPQSSSSSGANIKPMYASKGYYSLLSSPLLVRLWDGQSWQGPVFESAKIDVVGYVQNFETAPIRAEDDEQLDVGGSNDTQPEYDISDEVAERSKYTVEIPITLDKSQVSNVQTSAIPNPPRPMSVSTNQDFADGDADVTVKHFQQLIAAQNRTTHAIRALVRFLFIQFASITLGTFLWMLAGNSVDAYRCSQYGTSCDPNVPLQILAYIVWIAGIFISSQIGWKELEASNIPGENSGGMYRY